MFRGQALPARFCSSHPVATHGGSLVVGSIVFGCQNRSSGTTSLVEPCLFL